MALLLKTTRFIESQIDSFLDIVSDSATQYQLAVADYLAGRYAQYEERLSSVREYEHRADDLRISIERFLYERTLIPENRGDVLAILENTADVVYFFAREADHIGEKLRRQIFGMEMELSHKCQLRYFALQLEKISDAAQSVCDRLAIFTIKRQL